MGSALRTLGFLLMLPTAVMLAIAVWAALHSEQSVAAAGFAGGLLGFGGIALLFHLANVADRA